MKGQKRRSRREEQKWSRENRMKVGHGGSKAEENYEESKTGRGNEE